jgi:hypothetical protein
MCFFCIGSTTVYFRWFCVGRRLLFDKIVLPRLTFQGGDLGVFFPNLGEEAHSTGFEGV